MYPEEDEGEVVGLNLGVTPEQFLADQKRTLRRNSRWGIAIGAVIVALHVVGFFYLSSIQSEIETGLDEPISWKLLFRSIFFIFGLISMIGGLWGLYYASRLTLADLIPSAEAAKFLEEGIGTRPYYSIGLIGCLVAVTLVQLATDVGPTGERSGQIAGLVKPLFWQGEWWRIFTTATLHGFFPLHLYFNSQALYGFGTLTEQLSNRAHLPIVFMLAVVAGSLFSLLFMPNTIIPTIGASGGIMGLIGYMAVFGYKRKQQLPPDFLRSMLINIGFIAAFGLFGFQFIDNFAHLGGLVTGALYGLIQIPADPHADPRRTNIVIKILGIVSLIAFSFVCIFTAMKLTGRGLPI
jgi:membrane associated rhomboid family serine protease